MKTAFRATIIVAGTNNIIIESKILLNNGIVPRIPEPNAETITRIAPAHKNGIISLSVMFNKPITIPKTNRVITIIVEAVPCIKDTSNKPKIIAKIIPIKNAHAPIKLPLFFIFKHLKTPPFTFVYTLKYIIK